jgi:hypothetical protein
MEHDGQAVSVCASASTALGAGAKPALGAKPAPPDFAAAVIELETEGRTLHAQNVVSDAEASAVTAAAGCRILDSIAAETAAVELTIMEMGGSSTKLSSLSATSTIGQVTALVAAEQEIDDSSRIALYVSGEENPLCLTDTIGPVRALFMLLSPVVDDRETLRAVMDDCALSGGPQWVFSEGTLTAAEGKACACSMSVTAVRAVGEEIATAAVTIVTNSRNRAVLIDASKLPISQQAIRGRFSRRYYANGGSALTTVGARLLTASDSFWQRALKRTARRAEAVLGGP